MKAAGVWVLPEGEESLRQRSMQEAAGQRRKMSCDVFGEGLWLKGNSQHKRP